jgi:hypothetical protein
MKINNYQLAMGNVMNRSVLHSRNALTNKTGNKFRRGLVNRFSLRVKNTDSGFVKQKHPRAVFGKKTALALSDFGRGFCQNLIQSIIFFIGHVGVVIHHRKHSMKMGKNQLAMETMNNGEQE